MMKQLSLAIISTLSLSSQVLAETDNSYLKWNNQNLNTGWVINAINLPTTYSTDFALMALYEDGWMSFIDLEEKCDSSYKKNDIVMSVNGQNVSFERLCFNNVFFIVTKTDKGNSYVINEFETKSFVDVGLTTYPTNRFVRAVEYAKQISDNEAL